MKTAILLLASALEIFAQTFDVVSVKPAPERFDEARFVKLSETTGRIAYSNVTLKLLISIAYGCSDNRISGAAKWIDATPWDVTAVFPPETTKEQMHSMLRALLADRFALVTHKVSKDMPAYGLVVARKGSKLKQPTPGIEGGNYILPGRIVGPQLPIPALADMLGRQTGRPVVDMTGLTGNFDIDLRWTPDKVSEVSVRMSPASLFIRLSPNSWGSS